MIQMYRRASLVSTGTWANCTSATATEMTREIEKDSAVNGMVTVMPGIRILKKESANIWARRSVMMGMFPPWGFISYFFSMLAKSTALSYMQPSGLSRPQVFNLP